MSKMAYAASATNLMTTTLGYGLITGSEIAAVRGEGTDTSDYNTGPQSSPQFGIAYNYDHLPSPVYTWYSRLLVKFDLSAITWTPMSATLTLVGRGYESAGTGFVVARVLRDWGKWADYQLHPALPGESTWNSAKHGSVLWDTPGCDTEDVDRGAFSGEYTMPYGTFWSVQSVSIDVTSTVAAWVAGTYPNYGWVVAVVDAYDEDDKTQSLMTLYLSHDAVRTATLRIEYYPS